MLKPLESRLGQSLPDDYADFLVTHNGGRPEPAVFTFTPRDQEPAESRVQFFFDWCDDPNTVSVRPWTHTTTGSSPVSGALFAIRSGTCSFYRSGRKTRFRLVLGSRRGSRHCREAETDLATPYATPGHLYALLPAGLLLERIVVIGVGPRARGKAPC